MIKVEKVMDVKDFKAWSGGRDTLDTIIEHGKADELNELINELYQDGITDVTLNDLLWFESDWLFETLGIDTEE